MGKFNFNLETAAKGDVYGDRRPFLPEGEGWYLVTKSIGQDSKNPLKAGQFSFVVELQCIRAFAGDAAVGRTYAWITTSTSGGFASNTKKMTSVLMTGSTEFASEVTEEDMESVMGTAQEPSEYVGAVIHISGTKKENMKKPGNHFTDIQLLGRVLLDELNAAVEAGEIEEYEFCEDPAMEE